MTKNNRSPWSWVPSLYFTQGMPYVIVMTVAVIMYKRLGISNTDIALYTSWLYLPWVIKPLWSPVVDLLKTKRWWILTMQLIVGAGLAGVALTIPAPSFFQYTLAFLWLLAFSSATHDIAADGFYMLGLNKGEQAYFVGIRSTFYRIAMVTGQGLLIIAAGFLETQTGLEPIKFSVSTQSNTEIYSEFTAPSLGSDSDEMSFILTGTDYLLSTKPMDTGMADSLKQLAFAHNIQHGFIVPDGPELLKKPSWFARYISIPLRHKLKAVFSDADADIESQMVSTQGGVLLVGVRLSQKPEAPIVLVTNFSRGNQSLKIIAGERLEFTSANWDQPAWITIQADAKLNRAAIAQFSGRSGNIPLAWSTTFFWLTGLFLLLFLYHRLFLPKPETSLVAKSATGRDLFREFFKTFITFFKKKDIGVAIAFILLFRLGEAQLVKLAAPFLIDTRETGGLGLTTGDVGLVYGTFGIIALTIGGILGGLLASKKGLKYWLFPMTLAMNAPNLVYIYLSYFTPDNLWIITAAVSIEQFGYGFGFTAFILYLIYFSEGNHKTAHYAICTGLMALGMMIPGMISGWLQEIIGYEKFFIWVVICTIPGFVIIRYLNIDPEFGIRRKKDE
jgi:PAT family beta-lactamase induction signal transducer AmpG